MSVVGGTIETKDFPINFSSVDGNFNKVVHNGTLNLKVAKLDNNGQPIYEEEGYYVSEIVDLEDKFQRFNILTPSFTNSGTTYPSTFKMETRSGSSPARLGTWLEVDPVTYEIKSPTNRYIQVRIIFYAGYEFEDEVLSDFNNENDAKLFNGNLQLIDSTDGLKLKRNHRIKIAKTFDWNDIGTLGKYKFKESEWRRFDSFRLVHESEV